MEDGVGPDYSEFQDGTSRPLQTIANKTMKHLFLCSILVLAVCTTATPTAAQKRDGPHDFDFEIGNWKTHLKRLLHPLTGSTTWVEYDGTTVVRKVWNGRANLVELEVNGSAGHLEGL